MDYLGSSPPEVLALVRVVVWFKCKRPEKYQLAPGVVSIVEVLSFKAEQETTNTKPVDLD